MSEAIEYTGDGKQIVTRENNAPAQSGEVEDAIAEPLALLTEAVRNGAGVETIRGLLEMRKELKAEWAKEQYFKALSRFQAECPPIVKTRPVPNKDGSLRYKFAPIDAVIGTIKGPLARNGFSITRQPAQEEGQYVEATVVLHHCDGHSESATVKVPLSTGGNMNDAQHVGEAKSYASRYALLDVTGCVTADDDNDAGSLSFADGVSYSEYVNAIEAETDLEELRQLGKKYHGQLKAAGDEHGAEVILAVYNKRKAELTEGTK